MGRSSCCARRARWRPVTATPPGGGTRRSSPSTPAGEPGLRAMSPNAMPVLYPRRGWHVGWLTTQQLASPDTDDVKQAACICPLMRFPHRVQAGCDAFCRRSKRVHKGRVWQSDPTPPTRPGTASQRRRGQSGVQNQGPKRPQLLRPVIALLRPHFLCTHTWIALTWLL